MAKTGLAVKTYLGGKSSPDRLKIIKKSLDSLKDNVRDDLDEIVIVIDGETTHDHRDLVYSYSEIFDIVSLKDNLGIAGATNYGIKALLDKQVKIGFCSDDDLLFKPGFAKAYLNAVVNTGFHHYCFYPFKDLIERKVLKKFIHKVYERNHTKFIVYGYTKAARACPECQGQSCPACRTPCYFAGACYTFTKKMIEKIGYLPILPNRYGEEHVIFSSRYYRKFNHPKVDIYNSHAVLEIIDDSYDVKSDFYLKSEIEENKAAGKDLLDLDYIPYSIS